MTSKAITVAAATFTLMVSCFVFVLPANVSATNVTIFSEDFEDDSWTDGWYRTDYNSDSGADYWGGTEYRKYEGVRSAWCSQVGYNSVNALANYINHYYDQDMQAALEVSLLDLSGYDSVTLAFMYWASTGTYNLNDYLEVRAWTGDFWQHIWKQPTVSSGGWTYIAVSLPLETEWVSFTFISDEIEGLEPYEGVYVDSVLIYGWDGTPPESALDDLDEYYTSSSIALTYTAVDRGGSGIQYVELYYRVAGVTGTYTKYTTEDNPDGHWTDPYIPFDTNAALGDGIYYFFVEATDNGGNNETATFIPQTSTVIDTEAPVTTAEYPEPSGDGWWNTSVRIHLTSSDVTSGVAETMYRIDSENWTVYSEDIAMPSSGVHNVSYYSVDLAGNKEAAEQLTIRTDDIGPDIYLNGPFWELPLAIESPNTTISWIADDSQSGIDHCLFKVDDRAFEYFGSSVCDAEVRGLENGEHTVTIIAFDKAGNTATTFESFTVDFEGESESESNPELVGWLVALVVVVVAVFSVLLLRWAQRSEGKED